MRIDMYAQNCLKEMFVKGKHIYSINDKRENGEIHIYIKMGKKNKGVHRNKHNQNYIAIWLVLFN
jgi:hypothetical protein